MTNVIRKATNRFTKGLIMDFSPENTKNEVLTNALNATLLTFNGNELSLQNDMGNGRVETAYLPDGYMPVGTCEYGGIIYIVSYNPLEDKSQIGCFPSPERNISNKELGIEKAFVDRTVFQKFINGNPQEDGKILHNTQYVILKNNNLNPGDKFLICANDDIYDEKLADLWVDRDKDYYEGSGYEDPHDFELIKNPIIALNVVSIEDSGKIIYLNSDVKKYEVTKGDDKYTHTYKYHILGEMHETNNTYDLTEVDPDAYRNVLNSGYSVFKSKTSGKLAILAELIMIDSYSVTHRLEPKKDEGGHIVEGAFDIIIDTEVTPTLNDKNYYIEPKLQYYYLENSQGYLQVVGPDINDTKTLFTVKDNKNTGIYNSYFGDIPLNNIYEAIDPELNEILNPKIGKGPTLGQTAKFNFPRLGTYHGRMQALEEKDKDTSTYTKFLENRFHRINKNQVSNNADYFTQDLRAKFYFYNPSGEQYSKYTKDEIDNSYLYYVKNLKFDYFDVERNIEYKNTTLYKLITIPQLASKEEILDITVEKYKYQKIHIYRKATNADLINKEKLYYTNDNFTYIELIEEPKEGETYYVAILREELVSIGHVVDPNTVDGAIYYYAEDKSYTEASNFEKELYYDLVNYPNYPPITLYRREVTDYFADASEYEIANYKLLGIDLYYSTDYIFIDRIASYSGSNQVFVTFPMDTFIDYDKFAPNTHDNYINGSTKPSGDYPKDDPIFVYSLADYIPEVKPTNEGVVGENSKYFTYPALKLANITLPTIAVANGLDLPFKYDYTLVPCMNYGKLLHLAVSNTIDFSKLHAFNQSHFHTWKYRIDDNQLRLTFGADVYDTYETNRVDAIILEFYDLWGFAGSLEITDKKSYSGIFTKIIPLNSLKALSNKRIKENNYYSSYKRNVNIKEISEGSYLFADDNPIGEPDEEQGWNIPEIHPITKEVVNDCGTLYSNILYGVKAYFRRSGKDSNYEFIHKDNFFLYTLPIYNDYYYTVQNFNNLTYPELNFALTYKLKDASSKTAYVLEGISNGYNKTDKANVDRYLGGFYDTSSGNTSLNIIKYYKYKGTTKLYLEMGLSKEYEDLNISYNPEINNKYKCELFLYSDDDDVNNTFTVNSGMEGLTGLSQILNYDKSESKIDFNVNKLGFETIGNSYSNTISIDSLRSYNFISLENGSSININYEFVVGYTVDINNIRSTLVPATTVCALFHNKSVDDYNYEDFGIYAHDTGKTDSETNEPIYEYLSSSMFYNTGDSKKEIFGVCKQIGTTGTMESLLTDTASIETDSAEIKVAKKLNIGEPLRLLIHHVGKLTFCQPHVHGFSKEYGVNIYPANDGHGIGPSIDMDGDEGNGIPGDTHLYNNPKYNSCLNTQDMINHQGEFISTLDYKETTGQVIWANMDGSEEYKYKSGISMRAYTGLTGELLAEFNKKLLKTMSSVYAYNPDYDSLTVNAGNVNLLNYNPYFTSNLVNTNSRFQFSPLDSINNYIKLGTVLFSKYLNQLQKYSLSKDSSFIKTKEEVLGEDGNIYEQFLPLVTLKENFDNCGTKENKVLLSTLTYNTPAPKEIELELEFTSSNITVIKHSDGTNSFMHGSPDRKALYGYKANLDKMILLNVGNYTIDSDGNLKLKEESVSEIPNLSANITPELQKNLFFGTANLEHKFKINNDTISLNLGLLLSMYGSNSLLLPLQPGLDSFFMGLSYTNNLAEGLFVMRPTLFVHSSSNNQNYRYNVELESIELNCSGVALDPNEIGLTSGNIILLNLSYDSLKNLTSEFGGDVTLLTTNGSTVTEPVYKYLLSPNIYVTSDNGYVGGLLWPNSEGYIYFKYNASIPFNPEYTYLGLLEFKITKINFKVTQLAKLETISEQFVSVTKTNKYWDIKDNRYTIDSTYNDARIRGSSFTINDLVYVPNLEGHRLFVRSGVGTHNTKYRGKIYYRISKDNWNDDNERDWDCWDNDKQNTQYRNNLFVLTGPCYTPDYL